jgi:AcrR family transcriptional regulator
MTTQDYVEHRRRIGEVVMEVIARDGLDAVTVRRIAAEVGYSTTVVTHYFADKRDLLLSAYQSLGESSTLRFQRIFMRDRTDLVGYLLSLSAAEPGDARYMRMFIAVWDLSLRDPGFAAELRSWMDEVLNHMQTFIQILNPDCVNAETVARRLLALVHGIGAQILFYPGSWSLEAVREAFRTEVALLVGTPAADPAMPRAPAAPHGSTR